MQVGSNASADEASPRGGGYGGGYGGGHGGGYGGGYGDSYGASYGGNGYVDPYVVLASLAFGTFLFNTLTNLLNRSTRSTDVDDADLPLHLSDLPVAVPDALHDQRIQQDWNRLESNEKRPWLRKLRTGRRIVEAVRLEPSACARSLLCRLERDRSAWNSQPQLGLRALQLFIVSLAHHYGGGRGLAEYVDQLEADGGGDQCPDVCQHIELF